MYIDKHDYPLPIPLPRVYSFYVDEPHISASIACALHKPCLHSKMVIN